MAREKKVDVQPQAKQQAAKLYEVVRLFLSDDGIYNAGYQFEAGQVPAGKLRHWISTGLVKEST